MLHIRDHMGRLTHFLTPQLGLAEALDRLHHSGLSGLPVLDDQQQLVGFLSEQGLHSQSDHRQLPLRCSALLEDTMSRTPLSADPNYSDGIWCAR